MNNAPYQLLITGANRGIGLEFVRQYAAAGYRVFACCREPHHAVALTSLAASSGERISLHRLDVSDFRQIEQLAADLHGQAIDLLINNAGIYPNAAFGSLDYDAWHKAFLINTMAPAKTLECFVEHLAASRLRKVATLSSKMGSIADNGSGGSTLYRSSKAALNMVMKNLAIELKHLGIATCTLHPGWVKTDMGGANALITAEQSVAGMRQVIDRLTAQNSGRFTGYDGQEIPW